MARGVNKFIGIGHLGADPEIRQTAGGTQVTNIRIAMSEQWKGSDGQKQERTEWIGVVFFGKLAEIAGEYLKKGSKVFIEGRIQTRKWQGQDGQDRYTTEIVANEMNMLDSGGGQTQQQPAAGNAGTQKPAPASDTGGMEDDIPF